MPMDSKRKKENVSSTLMSNLAKESGKQWHGITESCPQGSQNAGLSSCQTYVQKQIHKVPSWRLPVSAGCCETRIIFPSSKIRVLPCSCATTKASTQPPPKADTDLLLLFSSALFRATFVQPSGDVEYAWAFGICSYEPCCCHGFRREPCINSIPTISTTSPEDSTKTTPGLKKTCILHTERI